jgi:hypothetical protein
MNFLSTFSPPASPRRKRNSSLGSLSNPRSPRVGRSNSVSVGNSSNINILGKRPSSSGESLIHDNATSIGNGSSSLPSQYSEGETISGGKDGSPSKRDRAGSLSPPRNSLNSMGTMLGGIMSKSPKSPRSPGPSSGKYNIKDLDGVEESGSSKSPGRNRSASNTPKKDRYIPNRSSIDFDFAGHVLNQVIHFYPPNFSAAAD